MSRHSGCSPLASEVRAAGWGGLAPRRPCPGSECSNIKGFRRLFLCLLALIGRVLPLQVQGRDTSEQIVVEIVHRRSSDRDEPKLVEHVVDQPGKAVLRQLLPASRVPM
jgi:hypothetical protein